MTSSVPGHKRAIVCRAVGTPCSVSSASTKSDTFEIFRCDGCDASGMLPGRCRCCGSCLGFRRCCSHARTTTSDVTATRRPACGRSTSRLNAEDGSSAGVRASSTSEARRASSSDEDIASGRHSPSPRKAEGAQKRHLTSYNLYFLLLDVDPSEIDKYWLRGPSSISSSSNNIPAVKWRE